MAITHMYAHVFGIISNPTFGFILLNKVTGRWQPKEMMMAATILVIW